VIDDNSTDDTVKIVRSLACDIKYLKIICLTSNSGGPAKPRNVGVLNAKSDLSAFVDGDDLWHLQKLEIQVELLERMKCDLVSTQTNKIYTTTDVKPQGVKNSIDSIIARTSRLKKRPFYARDSICTSTVLIRRAIAMEHKFNEDLCCSAIENYIAWRWIHRHVILESVRIELPLAFYRLHKGSISSSKRKMVQKVSSF
jgi:teichuronic acid biosynthesis glycosyltransferase TuaG